jgi:hypothetical protein
VAVCGSKGAPPRIPGTRMGREKENRLSVSNPLMDDASDEDDDEDGRVPQSQAAAAEKAEDAEVGVGATPGVRERGVWTDITTSHERHDKAKKVLESATKGTDPYVLLYLGAVRGKNVAKTESVVAAEANSYGRDPVWSPAQVKSTDNEVANVLFAQPGPDDQYVTLEVWDSDIDADDLLGGRTLRIESIMELIEGMEELGHRTMHVQLFSERDRVNPNRGFRRGHDAGLLRVRVSLEGTAIRFEVHAATDLLPDTPIIRDLRTYSDWRNTIRMLVILLIYLAVGTVYFAWFFGRYARMSSADVCMDGSSAGDAVDDDMPLVGYPGDGGQVADALLFMISTATTVGWGSQPVDFTSPPDESSVTHYKAAKVFVALNIITGIAAIGLLVGSLAQVCVLRYIF